MGPTLLMVMLPLLAGSALLIPARESIAPMVRREPMELLIMIEPDAVFSAASTVTAVSRPSSEPIPVAADRARFSEITLSPSARPSIIAPVFAVKVTVSRALIVFTMILPVALLTVTSLPTPIAVAVSMVRPSVSLINTEPLLAVTLRTVTAVSISPLPVAPTPVAAFRINSSAPTLTSSSTVTSVMTPAMEVMLTVPCPMTLPRDISVWALYTMLPSLMVLVEEPSAMLMSEAVAIKVISPPSERISPL